MSNITTTSLDMFEMMDKAYRFAEIIAKSDIIPSHYRGKPANTFIAVQTAYRMNLDPMLVMQNTYVINGKLGMNTTFAIALANQSGIFKAPFKYNIEGVGDNLKVTATAVLAKNGEEISTSVSMKTAIAENWVKNAKYKTMPEHMLTYRAATFLIRVYCPEVINGMHMVEELEDIKAATEPQDITPPLSQTLVENTSKADLINSKLSNLLKNKVEITTENGINNAERLQEVQQLTPDQRMEALSELTQLINDHQAAQEVVNKRLETQGLQSIEDMSDEMLIKATQWIREKYGTDIVPPLI